MFPISVLHRNSSYKAPHQLFEFKHHCECETFHCTSCFQNKCFLMIRYDGEENEKPTSSHNKLIDKSVKIDTRVKGNNSVSYDCIECYWCT